MSSMASQITSPTIIYSAVYSGADHRKHQSSASLAFVRGIHLRPVNSPHKGPATRKMFPFDDVIMCTGLIVGLRPDNDRRRYFVTTYFIGWAQTQNQPCCMMTSWHGNAFLITGRLQGKSAGDRWISVALPLCEVFGGWVCNNSKGDIGMICPVWKMLFPSWRYQCICSRSHNEYMTLKRFPRDCWIPLTKGPIIQSFVFMLLHFQLKTNSLTDGDLRHHIHHSQWAHGAIITSLWRRNGVAWLFWRHNDVIIAACARWAVTIVESTVRPNCVVVL